ncbi:autotransporter-associated beta strand repeat-containing protein [Nitratireductor luteus]|uniref:autotransporter-associated beta strand repeat-containing protein n=1 Tax=Nitratireductor luteus TaxID=2976980 RepID=UPI002240C8B2|nr:autotransporter-associated beta strand repeat-containing protein [Nitratireductor luteus]
MTIALDTMRGGMRQDSDTRTRGRLTISGPSNKPRFDANRDLHTVRGGRMTKWKGQAASYAPQVVGLFSCAARRVTIGLLPFALLIGLAAMPAAAADRYWDVNNTVIGHGGTGTWNTTDDVWSTNDDGVSGPYSSWDNGALDDAFFGGTAGTVTLGVPITVHNMTFQTGGYTITGGTLTLDGVAPAISVITGTSVIGSVIDSTSGLVKAGGGGLRLDGINTFNGGIEINGGTLHLNAANNFVGDVNINSGRLIVNGDTGLGDAGNMINMVSGTRLDAGATGGDLAGRTVSLTGGTAVIAGAGVGSAFFTGGGGVSASNSVAMANDANDYTGPTSFTGSGASSFTSIGDLGAASSLGAPTTVTDGTITFGNSNHTNHTLSYVGDGDSSNRNWQINPGSGPGGIRPQLRNSGTGTLTLTGDIALGGGSGNGPQFYAQSADMELLGVISSNNGRPVTFLADAGRIITLGDASTFSGTAIISGGTAGGTVQAGTIADIGVSSSLGAGTGIAIAGNDTLSYTGAGASSNRTWSLSNGTLANDGSGALTLSGDMTIANTATLGGSFTGADNVYAGVISGAGDLRSGGDATWVLTGTNTYNGDTIVDSGILRAGTVDAFGGSTDFVVNGGTLDMNGFDRTLTTLSGTGGTVELGSAALTLEAESGTSASYAGSITGSGGLTKLGASEQTLTGASTYTGDTTIGGGTLNLNFSAAGAPASNIIGSDSTFNMSGGSLNVIGADGAANTQTSDGLNIAAGNNVIAASSGTGGTMTVNLGAINRTGGLINFNLPESGNITTTNLSLGGWATVNGTDYAKVESGNILAFEESDYTDKDNAANWLDGEFITDVDGFFGTVSGSKQLGGLRYTQPVSTTVIVDPGETLGIDGPIIVSPSVEDFDQLITGGMLTGGTGGDLGIRQNSEGNFTIASQIVDNGGATGFIKAGTGLVTLTNAGNSYTGATQVVQGTLSVGNIGDGGMASGIGASSADSSNLVLEGGTLQYTGGTTSSDRGFTIVKSGDILGAGVEVTDTDANLIFSGLVTSPDDANFTKSGPGTLTLTNGTNDYIGITTVTGGMLGVTTLANGGEVSSIGQSGSDSANLVLDGGGLQYTGGTVTTDRGFTLGTNNGTVDVTDAGATLTFGGDVDGPGGTLIKEGDGTLVLSGSTNYTGGNTVNAGVLRAGGENTLGAFTNVGPTTLADAAGVTLDLNDFDNLIGPLNGGGVNGGNVTLGSGTLRIHRGNGDYSGVISGTGGIHRTGGGTQTFNGCNNTYTGSTLLQGGNLSTDCLQDGGLASGIGASSADSANLSFINAVLIYTGGNIAIDRGFQLQGGVGAINVNDAATTLEFEGAVIGGGHLRKDGAGTLVLSGTNTYTGNTQVTGGVLRAAATNAFGPQGEMTLNNTAGVLLDLDGYDTIVTSLNGGGTNGGNIELGSATLTILDGVNRTYAGAISGTGNLVKNGNRIQRLGGCNSGYTGSTTINGGELEVSCLADGGVNSSIGASTSDPANLVIDGGTLDYIGSGDGTDRQFTLGTNGGTVSSTGTDAVEFTNAGPVTLAGNDTARILTLTGDNIDTNIFSAQLDDNGTGATSLTKTGDGLWRLTNANSTYTGVTTLSGGVLEIDQMADGGMASSIGASTNDAVNLVIGNGSTLRYTGAGDTTDRQFTLDEGVTFIESSGTGALQFTNTGPAALTGTDTPRTIALGGTNTGDNTMGGAIGDNGAGATTLAKNDSGTWVLTGNNTFTGNTVINDGNLVIGNGGTTGNAGAGNVIVDSPTSTLSLNRSDTFTFDGTLSGPGTLAQIGTGTSVLTSPDNAIGATTISAGTLEADGGLETPTIAMTGTSALTVNGILQAEGPVQTSLTGNAGNQTVTVSAGGTLLANGALGGGSDTVSLAGLLDTGAGTLALGAGNDTLVLNDGAVIGGGGVTAGAGTDTLEVNKALAMTLDGASISDFEALTKDNTGTLTLTGDHGYTDGTTISDGTLQIGNGGTSGSLASDVLNNGTLAFNRSDTYTFSGLILGNGSAEQIGDGTIFLTGDNSYTGPTTVQSGSLYINGDQSGATGPTSVANGATLGGTGIIGGNVTLADGAVLDPGDPGAVPGTLTVNGDLTLNDGSLVSYSFGEANVVGGAFNDLTVVGGNLMLDGTLNVTETPGGSFGPGLYRIFSYDGTLTDNGLDVASPDLFVQTSVANQVNLVNASGSQLTFWDGAVGPLNDGIIQGGDGIWRLADNERWTTDAGAYNAPYSNSAFAVFTGTGGTVTIDNVNGQVEASGMQFAVDGYVIDGEPLTLVGGSSIIRVGDGTTEAADMAAVIDAVVDGASTLVKTDLGTLVLSGANSYTGGTRIETGTVQVANDGNLGDAAAGLAFDGGTLRNTASFTSARAVTLEGEGGTFQTDADLELTGVIGGVGALTKKGSAVLTLAGDNIYEGGTFIDAGVVSVSSDGNLGNAAGAISFDTGTLQNTASFASARTVSLEDGGGTLQTDADLQLSGVMGGTGPLTKTGDATLTLIAENSYAGGTTISSGILQLGDGGASGSILGGVLNNGTLTFNRSDTYTFAGLISGSGSVEQIGSGITILAGDNAYSGATTVQSGSLLINGDQSGATGLTSVENGAMLGGIGMIGGDVTVADGGTVNPGDLGIVPGTLTINGGFTLSAGSSLNYNFGQANVVGGAFNDLTLVGGDLDLDGTLNVTESAGGSFIPGIYRIISYEGALADNGLGLGSMPPGDFLVQTSIDKQVNLVNTTDVTLNFWDGPDGTVNDGSIHGGDGVWRLADNDDWTNDTGLINAPYSNGAFAVFAGRSGTVTIDNGNGEVEALGMQFAVDGYLIDGEPLTLVGGSSIIRVGDGTLDGMEMTATIEAELAGASTLVKADLGTLVLSGINIYTGGTVIDEGTLQISSDQNLGDAAGEITLDGGTLHNTASLESDRNVSLASGGTFLTDDGKIFTLNGTLVGPGGFTKAGGGTLVLAGTSSYDGAATVTDGTLQAGSAGAFSLSSAFTVGSDGALDLAGFDQTVASLVNAGTVILSSAPGTTLTVAGDYEGLGGTIILNAMLGEDDSVTDRLIVSGDTSGSTDLRVANIGGAGAQTVDGIKVIDVGGVSNGTFALRGDFIFEGDQAVVAGAYAYRLFKGGVSTPADGDWYLRSTLTDDEPSVPLFQPGVPLYEAYAGSLQTFNKLGTLQQRVGNRFRVARDAGSAEEGTDDTGIWARIEAAHADFEPKTSTSGTDYDTSTWRFQTGADGLLHEGEAGRLVAGASVHYGSVSSKVTSAHGNGSIDTTGYGVGGTLTWYGNTGFYLDGQAQVTWFDSDLYSTTARQSLVNDNDGTGYALSIEAGQRIALNETWALTPQAQLTYSSVRFDDFTDSFDVDVSLDRSRSLVGRLGLAVDRQTEWQDAEGRTGRSHLYGIANLYYDFADGSPVDVNGTPFASENDSWRGGVGLGGSINWADDKYSLYGEALANTSLENFGDSNMVSGTVGFRVRW